MKFQNPSLNSVLTGRTDKRTSRNQYAPHFFKVGGIKTCLISEPRREETCLYGFRPGLTKTGLYSIR